ncbi:MAG: hypothetical protein IKV48_01100 [Eggerthellaceae bacterium]|nr:hypothetical protein [Eggerthellaceae bacterium]
MMEFSFVIRKAAKLVFAAALSLVLVMPITAWASSDELTASKLEDGSESFSIANWNTEQKGVTNLADSTTIVLDEGAQSQANAGMLTYDMVVWGSCDECRTVKLTGSLVFLDSEGNELTKWSDSYEEYDTWRQQHTLSGSGIVPAGTASIKASASNHVGTKSDLELTGTLTISTTSADSISGNSAVYNIASFDGTGTFQMETGVTAQYWTTRELDATAEGVGDLRSSITIFFGEDARESIGKGIAFCDFYATFTDLEGAHSLDGYLDVRFFDKNGNELAPGLISLHGSDFGGLVSNSESAKVELYCDSEERSILNNTAYMRLEARATVGTLSDLASHISISFRHEEGRIPSWMSVSGAEVAVEEEATSELVVDTDSLLTLALRLTSAFARLQTDYSEKLMAINPYETISEQAVFTTLYVAKCIADGTSESMVFVKTLDQLRADAAAWAEGAGLGDLYESGVDTYAEVIGVIRTYMGSV